MGSMGIVTRIDACRSTLNQSQALKGGSGGVPFCAGKEVRSFEEHIQDASGGAEVAFPKGTNPPSGSSPSSNRPPDAIHSLQQLCLKPSASFSIKTKSQQR